MLYFFKKIYTHFLFFDLKLIIYKFFKKFEYFNFHKMENYLQSHPKGQIYPVSIVGWSVLSNFVI
jgi:hypothetical protein